MGNDLDDIDQWKMMIEGFIGFRGVSGPQMSYQNNRGKKKEEEK